ncbi:MAG: NUDIX hydrolase [Lachnospiraceae bacterium]|nr:NUDIX hydrolase [Lachnospiraceae bacterium]
MSVLFDINVKDEDKKLREEWKSTKEIFDGRILHVIDDTVICPNGNEASRELIRHVGAVCIVPMTDDGKVIVERQFRYPIDKVITEIPAGKLDSKSEDPLLAAQRELREETGYTADEWIHLGVFYPAPAYSDELIHVYIARKLKKGERDLDEDEFLDIYEVPLDELVDGVMNGEITDCKTQMAILKTKIRLTKECR